MKNEGIGASVEILDEEPHKKSSVGKFLGTSSLKVVYMSSNSVMVVDKAPNSSIKPSRWPQI